MRQTAPTAQRLSGTGAAPDDSTRSTAVRSASYGCASLTRSARSGSSAARASIAGTPPGQSFRVSARRGLRLRGGPSTDFDIITVLPFGTEVTVLAREGAWAKVDLEGDGRVDGFAQADFLEPVA